MSVHRIIVGVLCSMTLLMGGMPCQAGGPLGRMAKQSLRTKNAIGNIVRYHTTESTTLYRPVVTRFIKQVEHKPWEHSSPKELMYTSLGANALKFNRYVRPKLSIQQAEAVLQGKREKATLSSEELEAFYLSALPLAVVEGPYILTSREHQNALAFYRRILGEETSPHQMAWAKRMSAITNLGFLGSHSDAEIVLAAVLNEEVLVLEPWTDLIAIRALLNLEGYDEIKALLHARLQPRKGSSREPKISFAWQMLRELEVFQDQKTFGDIIPVERILHLGYNLPEKAQYLLINFNSYNIINLDFSADVTEAFLDLRQGILDKIKEDKVSSQRGKNLEQEVRKRLNLTYNHALQETKNPANMMLDDFFPGAGRMFANPEDCVSDFCQRAYSPMAGKVNLLPEQMLVRHNLQVRRWFPEITRQREFIEENVDLIDGLKEEQSFPANWEMLGLAEQVDLTTRNLLVGNGNISRSWKKLVDLSTALRVLQPKREIMVFTDVFAQMDPSTNRGMKSFFEDRKILVKDLLFHTPQNAPMLVTDKTIVSPGEVEESSFFDSLEGLRLQTDYFAKQISQARQAHPDALFVIYMPSRLVDKLVPFSLGRRLNKEETFVALLEKDTPILAQDMCMYDNFRAWHSFVKGEEYLTESVVKMPGSVPMINKLGPNGKGFKHVPLSDLVGFDMRILLP